MLLLKTLNLVKHKDLETQMDNQSEWGKNRERSDTNKTYFSSFVRGTF